LTWYSSKYELRWICEKRDFLGVLSATYSIKNLSLLYLWWWPCIAIFPFPLLLILPYSITDHVRFVSKTCLCNILGFIPFSRYLIQHLLIAFFCAQYKWHNISSNIAV
jgi:hypothetical protein